MMPHQDATQIILTPVMYIWQTIVTHDIEERERVRSEAEEVGDSGSMRWESTYINEDVEFIEIIELEPFIIDLP